LRTEIPIMCWNVGDSWKRRKIDHFHVTYFALLLQGLVDVEIEARRGTVWTEYWAGKVAVPL